LIGNKLLTFRITLPAAAAALVLGLSGPASAAPGFATGAVNLRAGPGTNYPQVLVVPAGAPVEIFGCVEGWNWCDVAFGEVRGWVSGNYLQYAYEGRRVPLPDYAPRVGVPIITFSFGDYWGSHYRGRPWYADRDRWGGPPSHRGPPPRAGFREPPRPDWRGPEDWRGPGRGPPEGRGPGRGPEDWRRGPDRGPDRVHADEGRGRAPGGWERGRGGDDGGRGGRGGGEHGEGGPRGR
jgi:uncharacterized protein YraI